MTFVVAAAVAGCSSVLSSLPEKMGGLPEGTPARSETPADYPKVHDMPPKRTEAILTETERRRLEIDLAAARDRKAPCYEEPAAKTAAADCKRKAAEKTEVKAR
jgi:hypothetical protein